MTRVVKHDIVAVAAIIAAAGCSGSSSTQVQSTPTAQRVVLTEHDNGRFIAVGQGARIEVDLHSTYWTLQPTSGPLSPDGAPSVQPSHCTVPGTGCGTVVATYVAESAGTAQLHAHRDSCGEALRCTGNAGDWHVTVTVR